LFYIILHCPTCKTSHHCAHTPQKIEMSITHPLHSVSDLYVETTVPKDFDSTLYHSLSWPPDTDTDDGSYNLHNSHSEESPDSESNTSRGHDKLTCGHRHMRHITPTPVRQASQSISVNAYEMGYIGEPCTTSEAGFSSPYICVKLLTNL